MTTRIILLLLVIVVTSVHGQDQEKKIELGLTVVTMNSYIGKDFFGLNIGPYEPPIVFSDGIFFRYSHKQVGLRAFSSFSKYKEKHWGYSSGTVTYKDFKVGVGGQYYIAKEADWLYTFIDAAYNNVYWSGSIFSDTPNDMYSYTATIKGFDFYFGLGLKFKMFKVISVSPEISYDFFTGQEANSRTSLITHETVYNTYNLAGNHPVFKLHVNYLF